MNEKDVCECAHERARHVEDGIGCLWSNGVDRFCPCTEFELFEENKDSVRGE